MRSYFATVLICFPEEIIWTGGSLQSWGVFALKPHNPTLDRRDQRQTGLGHRLVWHLQMILERNLVQLNQLYFVH